MEDKIKVYVGCDVGQKGGIAVIGNGKILYKSPTPLISKGEVDIRKFAQILLVLRKKYDIQHITFEALHAIFRVGAKATFGLGFQAGMVEGIVNVLGIPYTKIKAVTWQKEMYVGVKLLEKTVKFEGKSKTKVDTKGMAASAVKRLFPKENFVPNRCKNVHDGMVDATLIAEYSRRKGF